MQIQGNDGPRAAFDDGQSVLGWKAGAVRPKPVEPNSGGQSLRFRLIADFDVESNSAKDFLGQNGYTPQQRRFFETVLTVPEAFNRMCRLAIVSDFEAFPGQYFEGRFEGYDDKDIFDCIAPYLPEEDQEYWNHTRQTAAGFAQFAFPFFMEFSSSLRRVAIQDLANGELIPLRSRSRSKREI